MAINPDSFAAGFNERMSDLMSIQRTMEPVSDSCVLPLEAVCLPWVLVVHHHSVISQADPDHPVLAAGDVERSNMKMCEELGGIPYHINVVNYMVGTGSDVT